MSFTLRVKGETTPYQTLGTITKRNVVGSPITPGVVTTGSGNDVPGVLRYKVAAINDGVATVTCRVVNIGDSHHPLIDPVGTNITIGDGLLLPGTQQGDEYEVANGYAWDSDTSSWLPIRAFGVIMPGEPGPILTLEVANSGAPRVYSQLSWENTGPGFFSARVQGDGWSLASQSPIYLRDESGIDGYIGPDGTCVVEVRPEPDEGLDNSNNMVQLDLSIISYLV